MQFIFLQIIGIARSKRAVKARSDIRSLASVMKWWNVHGVKRGISTLLPTLTYGSETWTRSKAQQSRVLAVEIIYQRGARVVTRWGDERNENVYERCGMETQAYGVKCGVMEWV